MEAPENIQNYRRELCERCATPCVQQQNADFRREGDNECPSRRWMAYKTFPKAFRGAGDVVHAVAQPIAGAIDRVFKTNVKGCSGCAKRREMLNKYLPFPSNRQS